MKRLSLVVIFHIFMTALAYGEETLTVFDSRLSYARPDATLWKMVNNGKCEKSGKYLVMFERKPILDAQGHRVRPVMAIVCESVPEDMDVISYSIWKRGQTPFTVDKLITYQDGSFSHRNSVGYEGEYKKVVVHKIIIGHLRHGRLGAQVICDSSDGVFDKVEAEMRAFLRSIKLGQ